MATFTEVAVEATLTLSRKADGSTRVIARARSRSSEGLIVRSLTVDITDQLGPARLANGADLLDVVVARAKAHWQID